MTMWPDEKLPVGDELIEVYAFSMNWNARLIPGVWWNDISRAAHDTPMARDRFGANVFSVGTTTWSSTLLYERSAHPGLSGHLMECSFDTETPLNLTLTELLRQTIERVDSGAYLVEHSRLVTNVDGYEELAHGFGECWLLGTTVFPREGAQLDNPWLSDDPTFRVDYRPS